MIDTNHVLQMVSEGGECGEGGERRGCSGDVILGQVGILIYNRDILAMGMGLREVND